MDKVPDKTVVLRPRIWRYAVILSIGLALMSGGYALWTYEPGFFPVGVGMAGALFMLLGAVTAYIAATCKARIEVSGDGVSVRTARMVHTTAFTDIQSFGYIRRYGKEFLAIIYKRNIGLELTRSDHLILSVPREWTNPPLPAEFDNAVILDIANLGDRQVDAFIAGFREHYPQMPLSEWKA